MHRKTTQMRGADILGWGGGTSEGSRRQRLEGDGISVTVGGWVCSCIVKMLPGKLREAQVVFAVRVDGKRPGAGSSA